MPWRRHGITLGICILGIGVCGFLWNGYFGVMLTLGRRIGAVSADRVYTGGGTEGHCAGG